MAKTKIIIVEDQPKILKNQMKILSTFKQIDILGTAMNGKNGVALALKEQPDVVLLDLGLPDIDGIEVTKQIKEKQANIEILIFTIFEEEDKVVKAIKAGACGYLLKGTPADKIVDAIEDVHSGGSVIQPSLARNLLKVFIKDEDKTSTDAISSAPDDYYDLTPREVEILQIVAKGLSNNETASVLGISKATIRTHLEHIYQKLDVTNRVEAVTTGIRGGIIDL